MANTKKTNSGSWLLWGALGLGVLGVGVYAVATSGTTPAEETAPTVTLGKDDPNLTFTEAEKAQALALVTEGKVRSFLQDSHEVWVDPGYWKGLAEKDRQRLVLLFASINRDYDGTRQISVKEWETDRTLGEYFSGNLRVEP